MANIYQTAQTFKRDLLQSERQAASDMVNAYGQAWTRLKGQLDTLTQQIEEARAAGVDVSQSWLLRQERYKALLAQTQYEIGQYARYADSSIRSQQSAAIQAAQDHARQLTLAGLGDTPEAARIIGTWNRVPAEALQHLVGTLADGSPLATLLDQLAPAACLATKKALTTGVVLGNNPRDIARAIRQEAGLGLTRSLTIARTETLRAYRQASIENYAANEDVVNGWIWTATLGPRTCAACLAMHGTRHAVDEVFASHPNCRCAPVPITKSWAELGLPEVDDLPDEVFSGEEWFAQQDASTQEQILGPAKYAAFKAGRISLSDLVAYRDDPKWGPQRSEASLQEAEAKAANNQRRRAA